MKKIEKILYYLESQGISIAEFERRNELGNGYIKKTHKAGADITNKMLERIRENSKGVYDYLMGNSDMEPEKVNTKKPAPVNEEGLKEDLIAALKMNNALLEQRVKELEARQAPLPSTGTDIADHLSKIQNETRELLILVLESQRYLLKQQAASPKKYLEALRTIQRTALDSLEKDLQWGTDEGTNDN